jgi:Flp pilus assembly protein TadD
MPSLGIAHPPGYPLLTLLGKFYLTFIPGNTAFVLNILSSLLTACAAGIGAIVMRDVLFRNEHRNEAQSVVISSCVGCLFGFGNALWASAVGIEVHSLGIVLILLSLWSLNLFFETGKSRHILLSVYLLSLGMANHLTAVALGPPILYALIRARAPLRIWIYSGLLFIFGLTIYLYIPIRSLNDLIQNWDNLASPGALWDHLTAKRYQGYMTGVTPENFFENFGRSLALLAGQFPVWLGLLGMFGLAVAKKIGKPFKVAAVLIIAYNLITVALYDIPDIDQYYLPSYFLATLGVAALLLWLWERLVRTKQSAAGWPVYALSIILVVLTIATNYRKNDQSHNRLSYIYGMNILNCVPKNSILISSGDNSNSTVQYLHFVEGVRSDLEIYDPLKTTGLLRKKLMVEKGGLGTGAELCMRMLSAYPERSYLSKEHMLRKNSAFNYNSMTLTPHGMVYRLGNFPIDMAIWNRLEFPKSDDITNIDVKGLTMLCNLYLNRGEDRQRAGDSTAAYRDFMQACDLASISSEATVHNSLGIFFRRHRISGLAEDEYRKALESRHLTADEKANIFVNLGNLRKDHGKFDEAIELYNRAIGINGENIEARYNLALTRAYLAVNAGQYADAVRGFEEALTISVADPRLIYNLGVLYDINLHDTARAIYNYRKFVEIVSPDIPESRTAQKRIEELSR